MSKQEIGPTEEKFLKDVSEHEVKILLDNGVYRHLRCAKPGSSFSWFDLVTWPGHLAYAGDMGSFTFSRLEDMFKFFRTDRRDDRLGINRSYWGEKLEAVDRDGRTSSHRQFIGELLSARVEEHLATWLEEDDLDNEDKEQLRYEVEEDVLAYIEDNEYEARRAVSNFSAKIGGHTFEFHDSWEWDCEGYTYRFTWCCYAIAWAIKQYDLMKDTNETS